MAGFYDDAGFLQAANIDALIVTGAEPRERRPARRALLAGTGAC